MTIVPSIGTVSSVRRMAVTAASSDLWRSPCPMVWPAAMAACSTTRRNSSERSAFIWASAPGGNCGFVGRQFAACRAIRPRSEQIIRLHDLVNLARALVDHRALAVAIETADRILVRVAVRAMHLHRVTGGAFRGDGREPLGETSLARVAAAFVLHRGIAAGLDQAGGAGGDREAALIEREHGDLEPLAFAAEQVFGGHFDVIHLEEAGVAGEDAPLVLQRAAGKALEAALDQEGA